MTRQQFDQELAGVRQMLHNMLDQVAEMVLLAGEAASTGDESTLRRIVEMDNAIDEMEETTVMRVLEMIILQAPVSKDARFLATVLAIVGEIEQAGDDAVKLSKRLRRLGDDFPDGFRLPLGSLAEAVVDTLRSAGDLIDNYTDTRASEIIAGDNAIDSGYKQARDHVLSIADLHPPMSRQTFWTIEAFHALEHVADHAVEIAKRMKKLHEGFSAT